MKLSKLTKTIGRLRVMLCLYLFVCLSSYFTNISIRDTVGVINK